MALIAHALAGEGRGHLSRARALAQALREADHEVVFCCGGSAARALAADGERVLRVPAFRPALGGNRALWLHTVARNLGTALGPLPLVRVCEQLSAAAPQLVSCDLEPLTAVAAELAGLPTVTLGRQPVVLETTVRPPPRFRPQALATAAAVAMLSPQRPQRVLVEHLYDAPLRRPRWVRWVPPLLRREVLELCPRDGDAVLVYLNHPPGRALWAALEASGTRFVLYGAGGRAAAGAPANVELRSPSREGFLQDLASCRAVVATAGFNLMAEAAFLGKPLLALPNGGQYEQLLNALLLARAGAGRVAYGGVVEAAALQRFLARPPRVARRLDLARGAARVVQALEAELRAARSGAAGRGSVGPGVGPGVGSEGVARRVVRP